MNFNKSFFPILVFGMLMYSCANDAPESADHQTDSTTTELPEQRQIAEAKIDEVLTAAPKLTEAEIAAKKAAEAEAVKAEKERLAKEEKLAKKKEREEEASKKRRKKRHEKRRKKREAKKAAEAAAKKAAEQSQVVVSQTNIPEPVVVKNTQQVPVEYAEVITTKGPATSGSPAVRFHTTVHNYGKIEQGDKIEYKFKFKNTGSSELVVTDATATCGCTRPSYPFIPIGPGEEGYIGVVFDTKGKLGRQKPAITVTTNADPASYTLYLEGFVDSPTEEEEEAPKDVEEETEEGK